MKFFGSEMTPPFGNFPEIHSNPGTQASLSSARSSYSDDGLLLAPTGALVVAPLPRFHITSLCSSKSLYNLLTLLKIWSIYAHI